jgi:hypothetical protein
VTWKKTMHVFQAADLAVDDDASHGIDDPSARERGGSVHSSGVIYPRTVLDNKIASLVDAIPPDEGAQRCEKADLKTAPHFAFVPLRRRSKQMTTIRPLPDRIPIFSVLERLTGDAGPVRR